MLKFLRSVFVLIGLITCTAAAGPAIPFPQATSDLQPDPAARFGTLPNGVRYVLMHNAEPKGRASLRLSIGAGSFNETDDQRGLAHFLEHMAFNGSTHYAPGTLIEFFQRMGMNFGGDTNAFTSFDRTVYMIELPDTKPATVTEGLQVFADYAGGLLLEEKEIDKERGIILSEKRTRDSVEFRTFVSTLEFTLPNTLLPKRLPIGQEEIIRTATRERFTDFYNTWYRPSLTSVIVVGDIDLAQVEAEIVRQFSPLAARAPEKPAPDRGRVESTDGLHVKYIPEPEAASTRVTLSTLTPFSGEIDNRANRLKDIPRMLAHAMLNRRLSILAKKEGAVFTSAGTGMDESFDLYRQAVMTLTTKPADWAGALAVGEQELRRALEHGFQPAELTEVTANFINSLEQAERSSTTRRSDDLASEIADSLNDRSVFTTPADDLALYRPALKKITVDDCLAALRKAWSAPHRYIVVSGNVSLPSDADKVIKNAYESARTVAVSAPDNENELTFAYPDFGPAGAISKRSKVEDLDLHLIEFANGVRLNLKKTDFESNVIRITARVGTGLLTEPRSQPGLAFVANNTFTAGGLGKHSADDLQRILAGKTVGVGFSVGQDAFVFSGGTNQTDLLLELQLLTAYLTDPGYRPESLRVAQKRLEPFYTSLEHTPSGPLQLEVARLLAGGDPRFGTPDRKDAEARTLAEIKDWLSPELNRGAVELSIIGDIDLEATIASVARTFGTLPLREKKPALENLRALDLPTRPFDKNYTVPTEIPKGVVMLYWPTTDSRDIKVTRRLNLLANVLTDRLRVKVREEIGGAYSPSAGNSSNDVFPGYGWLLANITVDPAKAREIGDITVELADDLNKNGVTADELERARLPLLTSLRESLRSNAYWLNVLSRAQEKPETLDWARTRDADVASITDKDLDVLARKYLGASRAFRATVLPEKTTNETVATGAAVLP